ncbi:hypothetical protein FGG08_001634 [Glutinoglossum americanum]|uniref:Uncharacterized protein n=1 Tax=Glutinoglossum americanum TaxID=1670608 RepID=A0A9P8L564_9PEZI|nr:hypothetical protein FGG08_001634 [Glutinoglossum americanum]
MVGRGNIGEDKTEYVDGEIVRQGVQGESADGAYSTGRGGAANIAGSPHAKAARRSDEIIPEAALRPSQDEYHVGRGGGGNVHHAGGDKKDFAHDGLADKLKRKLFGKKPADKAEEDAPNPATTA